ncbi:MAG: phospho-sugar mutase, partial [Ruthenibacterium sp.]
MENKEYKRWLSTELEDKDLMPELLSIQGIDEEIEDRFAVELSFGTAGLRGVLGAGTNRMNIYMVRKATQGLANYLNQSGGKQVAISYDSRIKSDVFAKEAARVLAANGIKVFLYHELMPVPALSFATRYLHCDAGIMVTASHNPAKYNGYKAYGPDGCQMTSEAADAVYAAMLKTDVFADVKLVDFDAALADGIVSYIGQNTIDALYQNIEA